MESTLFKALKNFDQLVYLTILYTVLYLIILLNCSLECCVWVVVPSQRGRICREDSLP